MGTLIHLQIKFDDFFSLSYRRCIVDLQHEPEHAVRLLDQRNEAAVCLHQHGQASTRIPSPQI